VEPSAYRAIEQAIHKLETAENKVTLEIISTAQITAGDVTV
jgi:hypothetical protein